MVSSAAEAPKGAALAAAAAALLPPAVQHLQIRTPIFAADIDSAEKGTASTTTVPLEMKRSSAPKSSEATAPPIAEAEERIEQTIASSTGVNRYAEVYAAAEGAIQELADRKISGRK
jgi:hypothetical protein